MGGKPVISKLTDELKAEIVLFCRTNTMADAARRFHLSRDSIRRIIKPEAYNRRLERWRAGYRADPKGSYRPTVSPEADMERERAYDTTRWTTGQQLLGDPPIGRSALDRRP